MDTIICVVERITYRNKENSYTVIKAKVKGYRNIITAVGYINFVNVGSVLKLYGNWEFDKKYGRQLNVIKYEESIPDNISDIEKYLGNGLIKGIGATYAKKIVSKFKENTLKILDNEPDRLLEIKGLGKKRVEIIKNSWIEQKEVRSIMLFLQEHEVSTKHAYRIFQTYGNKSIEVLKENPYRLVDEIWGIGFKTADTIASKIGIDKESYIRCRSGVLYTLNELSNSGHCYANLEQLITKAVELLDIGEDKIAITVDYMRQIKEVIAEDKLLDTSYSRYYIPSIYFSEVGVSKLIKIIVSTPSLKKIKDYNIGSKISYDDIQKKSIQITINSKFTIITGGAGTGKTTTTIGIIEVFKNNNFNILLAAPTGRAAKRMSEATGLEAKTIHRLLEFKPPCGYQKNEKNKLSADVLIVDEASMIDIVLMYNLLKAVPPYMIVVLIGDKHQLPSIGCGNVFRDIIESETIPVIKLEKIYRQASNSDIIENAHKINKGLLLDLKNKKNSDFFYIESVNDNDIEKVVIDLFTRRLPKRYKINPIYDIQILCPMQKGVSGTQNINSILQETINRNSLFINKNGIKFCLNDKVMQIKNNYDKDIFNGDIGIISNINLEDFIVTVDFDNKLIEYNINELDELVLSYAITIHKSQGSEYPIVIMPISMSHFIMLQRNLIYTGITRAKKLLIVVGDKKAISCAINNNNVIKRNTWLKNRLKEA